MVLLLVSGRHCGNHASIKEKKFCEQEQNSSVRLTFVSHRGHARPRRCEKECKSMHAVRREIEGEKRRQIPMVSVQCPTPPALASTCSKTPAGVDVSFRFGFLV